VARDQIGNIVKPDDRLICLEGESHVVEGCFVVTRRRRQELLEHSLYKVHIPNCDTFELRSPEKGEEHIDYKPGGTNSVEIAAVLICVVPFPESK
jgi:hypothetical protein